MHRNAPLSPMKRVPEHTTPMENTAMAPMTPMHLVEKIRALFAVAGPSSRRLFGPLFTITKGYPPPFYHTKRAPRAGRGVRGQDQGPVGGRQRLRGRARARPHRRVAPPTRASAPHQTREEIRCLCFWSENATAPVRSSEGAAALPRCTTAHRFHTRLAY
jgi:hypothetical protein